MQSTYPFPSFIDALWWHVDWYFEESDRQRPERVQRGATNESADQFTPAINDWLRSRLPTDSRWEKRWWQNIIVYRLFMRGRLVLLDNNPAISVPAAIQGINTAENRDSFCVMIWQTFPEIVAAWPLTEPQRNSLIGSFVGALEQVIGAIADARPSQELAGWHLLLDRMEADARRLGFGSAPLTLDHVVSSDGSGGNSVHWSYPNGNDGGVAPFSWWPGADTPRGIARMFKREKGLGEPAKHDLIAALRQWQRAARMTAASGEMGTIVETKVAPPGNAKVDEWLPDAKGLNIVRAAIQLNMACTREQLSDRSGHDAKTVRKRLAELVEHDLLRETENDKIVATSKGRAMVSRESP